MPTVADQVFGREAELASMGAFLDHPGVAPRALVLLGDAGIGKTTLWQAGIALASERRYQICSTRPTETEVKLSYAGLGDLFDRLGADKLADLPGPQRVALEVALLRADVPAGGLDHRTLCVAVLTALRSMAASAPLLIAVDDLQWLDGATAQVLEFVVRRLKGESISVIATLRARTDRPAALARALRDDDVQTIQVEGLTVQSLGRLLQTRLGTNLSKPTINRLLQASGGNPFFALEIARALISGRLQFEPGASFSVPADLAELVPNHIGELPAPTRELLLLCSAVSMPTTSLLRSAVSDPMRVSSDLRRAVTSGVIELEGEQIRFTHPLLSSAVYSQASDDQRRGIHRRLAAVVLDAEERARHLGLAAESSDLKAAAALEQAASLARARGAPATAAELCELAERLVPPDRDWDLRRLRLTAADDLLLAGDLTRAEQLAELVEATAREGPERSQGLFLHALVRYWVFDFSRAADLLSEALVQPGVPPEQLSALHSWSSAALRYDLPQAARHAEEAVRLAASSEDPTLLALAFTSLIGVRMLLGWEVPDPLRERAMEIDEAARPRFVNDRPSAELVMRLIYAGELDKARPIVLHLLDEALAKGDEFSVQHLSAKLGVIELLAGDWEASLEHYARASLATGANFPSSLLLMAHKGDVAVAATEAQTYLESAARRSDLAAQIRYLSVLGFVELSNGNADSAHRYLQDAWDMHRRWGIGEPCTHLFVADHIEALVALGRYEDASKVLDWLEDRGRILDRPWALAVSSRYRGLLAAGRGDLPAALVSLDDALRHHERLPMPFELGRTLLIYGTIRRRAQQKRPAREALEQALGIFERLGAPLWADKARAELARISGRRSSAGELTQAERRVSRLAAAGRTNREIAEALSMSTRTVEGHLSHAYAKLGVRSRTELATLAEILQDAPGHC